MASPSGAVAFCGAETTKPRGSRPQGFVLDRSGVRRSQEQGESRMTVYAGRQKPEICFGVGSACCREMPIDNPPARVNKL
jgi:hypothetical protein